MGEFIDAIGSGISGLVIGAVNTFASLVRGMAGTLDSLLPGGLLFVAVFAGLLIGAWTLAKR
jgi:hypothetical protein